MSEDFDERLAPAELAALQAFDDARSIGTPGPIRLSLSQRLLAIGALTKDGSGRYDITEKGRLILAEKTGLKRPPIEGSAQGRDGAIYTFVVHCTAALGKLLLAARVRRDRELKGTPTCVLMLPGQVATDGEIEDLMRTWIEGVIADGVGIDP